MNTQPPPTDTSAKPMECPFCNAEAAVADYSDHMGARYVAVWPNCNCCKGKAFRYEPPIAGFGALTKQVCINAAVRAWNTRPATRPMPYAQEVGEPHWHRDIKEAVAHVEKTSIEQMERAITACQDWDVAGLVNEGLVTDMAVAYLETRKAQPVGSSAVKDLLNYYDTIWRQAAGVCLERDRKIKDAIRVAEQRQVPEVKITSLTLGDKFKGRITEAEALELVGCAIAPYKLVLKSIPDDANGGA